MKTADVLIAGGGLAGSALAIQLGRLGLSVELFERRKFPKEKLCGEGLMPAGVAALERLALNNVVEGAPFFGIRYHCPGRVVKGCFPPLNGLPSAGRGYRRRDLDQAVFAAAGETRGVTVHAGTSVEAAQFENGRVTGLIVDGRPRHGWLVVAADGAQSRLRYSLGLVAPGRRKRVGIGAHFRLAPGQQASQWVDVHLGRGFELYVTPLRQRELRVAALAHSEAICGSIEGQYRRWWNGEPKLVELLREAEQVSELQVTSPLSGRARRRFLPGLVLLGDAAGFSDPITGGGMTQALISAELLAHYAAEGFDMTDRWLAEFDFEREAMLRDYRRITAAMLWLADHPALMARTLKTVARWPRLFSHLIGVSSGLRHLRGGEVQWNAQPHRVRAAGGRNSIVAEKTGSR